MTYQIPWWRFASELPSFIAVSRAGEIIVSLSSSSLIPAVLDNYDLSSISRVVNVDRGQDLSIVEVLSETSVSKSLGNQSIEHKKTTANGIAPKTKKSIDTEKKPAVSNGQELPSYICQTTEIRPLTPAKKKRIVYILKNCHSSMAKNDKLLLLATVFTNSVASNNPQSSNSSKWLYLAMFFMTGGRERRETEYRKLLATAGFKLTKTVNIQSSISVLEAVKV